MTVPVSFERLERTVLDVIARGALKVPPYPAVAMRVNDAARNPRTGLAEVSRIVRADPALAADVLRCANSAFFRRGATVTSLTHAVTRIGAQEVMRIALAASLGAYARKSGPLATIRRRLWIESLASAAICDELGRARGARSEDAFMLGLLHDFGKVVAAAGIESILGAEPLPEPWPFATWITLIERLHVPAGRELGTSWNLPQLLIQVISNHHDAAAAAAAGGDRMLAIVRASDEVVALLTTSLSVSPEDLAAVETLSSLERKRVAYVIELIPELVASFEGAPGSTGVQEGSAVASPEERIGIEGRAVAFPASVKVCGRALQCTVVSVAPDGLEMTGPEYLTQNRLVRIELRCPSGPFAMWALVHSCRNLGETIRAELRPFALTKDERSAWDQLTASARQGA